MWWYLVWNIAMFASNLQKFRLLIDASLFKYIEPCGGPVHRCSYILRTWHESTRGLRADWWTWNNFNFVAKNGYESQAATNWKWLRDFADLLHCYGDLGDRRLCSVPEEIGPIKCLKLQISNLVTFAWSSILGCGYLTLEEDTAYVETWSLECWVFLRQHIPHATQHVVD